MMINRFSYSSLETFKKCPAQFRFRYIDKINKPDEGIEAFMGKRVHEALEYLYEEVMASRLPFLDGVIETYHQVWEDNWHDRIAIVRKENKPKFYFELGERCIAAYYRTFSPFDQPAIGTEVEYIFSVDNSEDYMMKGIMDRLDHDGQGNYEIHDYKSGKRMLTQYNADRDGQLALYQIALHGHREDVKSVKLVWHFLQHNQKVESTRNAYQLDQLKNQTKSRIDEIRSHIKNGNPFNPKESILCNWCYYWEECSVKTGSNPYI